MEGEAGMDELLRGVIDEALTDNSVATLPSRLVNALDTIVEGGHLAEHVRCVRLNRWDPTHGSSGYRHPNGFDKVTLASGFRIPWKLVAHVWQPTNSLPEIHDHRWDFASRVIAGSLVMRHFVEAPGGTGVKRFEHAYWSPGAEHEFRFEYLRPANLVENFACSVRAQSNFALQADVIHDAHPGADNDLTLTLVLEGPPQKEQTRVFVDAPFSGMRRQLVPLSEMELLARLAVLESHLLSAKNV